MKYKDILLSIVLNIFWGYVWIFLIYHILGLTELKGNTLIIGVTLIIVGTILFGEIIRRINPLFEYKINHPVKIVGFLSFGIVVTCNLYLITF
ncbi:hypothetical protein [Metabacillus fastidiosus]|uniref:hypothetical protein n=1 Tax=Metabacillus fastidiosus TaxID=1458 RepID=UPI003D2728B5